MSQLAPVLTPTLSQGASEREAASETRLWLIGAAALILFALALRLAGADQYSAYMDEGTNVLTGRMLVEQHAVYAEVLNWAYGSYLWPLVAGVADELGGLSLVRGVTAACGVVMVLATALAAVRLAPVGLSRERHWAIGLIAGGIMAVAPTAIGVGRFGTYDALAGAGFMLGVALLLDSDDGSVPAPQLLAAAALLFVAFLSKYLVAIYFPFVCVYVVARHGRQLRAAARDAIWFVVPLTRAMRHLRRRLSGAAPELAVVVAPLRRPEKPRPRARVHLESARAAVAGPGHSVRLAIRDVARADLSLVRRDYRGVPGRRPPGL